MVTHHPFYSTMVPSSEEAAATIASWCATSAEAAVWVSATEPVTAAVIAGWWRRPDVSPILLLDPDGSPVAYGEVWDDEEEDEVELARLIVNPARRREGIGRRLVRVLLDRACGLGRSDCFLRVIPSNNAARNLYLSTGFVEVDEASAALWNEGQPATYTWMRYQPHPPRMRT